MRDPTSRIRQAQMMALIFSISRTTLIVLICLGATSGFARDMTPTRIAVAHFDFVDTSGEVKDQKARHEELLRLFETELQQTLTQDDRLELVALTCGSGRCSSADPGVARLASQARAANARYLLAGGVHKMSTLVGWAQFTLFDLENNRVACDRLVTYRGDTTEAWRRAGKFGAKDVLRACFP